MSLSKLNLLIAFPYAKPPMIKTLLPMKDNVRFLLDSGAFTAWKAGKPIKLDDYCRFLDSLPLKPWRYFTLDVIGDPHGSMQNYETMLKRGYNPVPIFTRGEDPSVLDDYYKTSDVVGIGGLVGTKQNKGFVNGIMKHVGKRKVHWLGFTPMDYIKYYKPYMCDSSGWESGARFATLDLYMGKGKSVKLSKKDFLTKPDDKIINRLDKLNIGWHKLAKAENWSGGPSVSRNLCAASGVAMSMDIEKNVKTKMFLAVAATEGASLLIKHYKKQVGLE